MNSNKRIAATVYSLGTLFISGIYVQIPCRKEIMTIIIIIIIIIIVLRKVLTLKHNRANAETRDIGTINNNNRIAATMYSLGTLFVSGIYV
jgi:Na+/melibiose symporter-like transporter